MIGLRVSHRVRCTRLEGESPKVNHQGWEYSSKIFVDLHDRNTSLYGMAALTSTDKRLECIRRELKFECFAVCPPGECYWEHCHWPMPSTGLQYRVAFEGADWFTVSMKDQISK